MELFFLRLSFVLICVAVGLCILSVVLDMAVKSRRGKKGLEAANRSHDPKPEAHN